MSDKTILIGADPELFVMDLRTGKYISAHDLLPGNKAEPFFIKDGAVQPDGVAAEFNIMPAANVSEFVQRIESVRYEMFSMISRKMPNSILSLAATPTVMFDEEYFKSLPAIARALGCQPDYNAYAGRQNPPPRTKKPMRTGSGHIHIGWTSGQDKDKAHMDLCADVIKQLDSVFYPISLVYDKDRSRQELYGKPGCFRPKHYGVEYRTLSNAWLGLGGEMLVWVYQTAHKAVDLYFDGVKIFDDFDFSPTDPILSGSDETLMNFHFKIVEEYDLPECPTYLFYDGNREDDELESSGVGYVEQWASIHDD